MTSSNLPAPDDDRRARLRAADADRELVSQILAAAMSNGTLSLSEYEERTGLLLAAKTFGELDALTDDLPIQQLGVTIPPSSGVAVSSARVGDGHGRRQVNNAFALMSGTEIGGNSAVGSELNAVSIMGGVELDLRDVEFTAPHLTIRCAVIMGGIDITVAPDVTLEIGGLPIMGGFAGKAAGAGAPGAPHITITGFALMGGVEVKRKERGH